MTVVLLFLIPTEKISVKKSFFSLTTDKKMFPERFAKLNMKEPWLNMYALLPDSGSKSSGVQEEGQ